MQRVPLLTVVDKPPTEQSPATLLDMKFQVPFEALLARLVPPAYITVADAEAKLPTVRGASICLSTRQPSGMARVAAWASLSHMLSKFWVTCGAAAVNCGALCAHELPPIAVLKNSRAAVFRKVENFFIVQ